MMEIGREEPVKKDADIPKIEESSKTHQMDQKIKEEAQDSKLESEQHTHEGQKEDPPGLRRLDGSHEKLIFDPTLLTNNHLIRPWNQTMKN